MTSITDRLTDAMTAAASTVRDEELRPLATPPRRRRPRAPRWWHSAWAAPVAAAAAVTLVVSLSMWVSNGFGTQQAAGPAKLPPAPREFSMLIPNVSFGWLPAGNSVGQGGGRRTDVFMDGGRPPAYLGWGVHAYARGRCRLTGSVLTCTTNGIRGVAAAWRISGRAPAVDGHRAFWAGRALVWQYARSGWAALMTPAAKPSDLRQHPARQHTALKVARHIRFGAATPPLVFPATFTGLPGQWQVSDVHYWGGSGVLQADEYVLTTGASRLHPRVGDVGIWTGAAYVDIHPTPKGATCTPHDPSSRNTSEVINGHRVVVKRMTIGG
ncbi:MAG: hypothetical protein J2P35_04505, partial [Actinobacteria bacterium]|nr:hypothetical protein [Actinomycetota bacterium]